MTPTEFFRDLNKNTMSIVEDFYAPDATLVDPLGEIQGAKRIRAYYAYQYNNVLEISWDMEPEIVSGDQRVLFWKMNLRTKNLNGGEPFSVPGSSRFRLDPQGKVLFHQDYFDVGAFVYERVPVLKNVIFYLKSKLKKGLENAEG